MAHTETEVEMKDVENDSNSDSEDSSDSQDEEELSQKISELQKQTSKNPYEYNPHVELIGLLRQDGDLERLRTAREKMSAIFPLTPELWLQWLQDEIKLVASDTDREHVTKLFERAVKDYLSVDLWLEYVQFAIGEMGSTDGIAKVRNVFERALTASGLHVVKGNVLWEAYREFENAILATLQPSPESILSESQQQEYESQRNRVSSIFKRQLNVPLMDMENTFEEFKTWEEPIKPSIVSAYQKTYEKLEQLKPFEELLLLSPSTRLADYESYIEFELQSNDPPRIQCLFERAIAENCLNHELWLKYITYLESKLKINTLSLPVLERSVRNCPWSVKLWQYYVRAMERYDQSHESIKEVVDTALKAGFTCAEEFQQIWLTFLDYLRRRIVWDKSDSQELEELRTTFLRAHNHIVEYFGQNIDTTAPILRYWARVEAYRCKNMEKARELWYEIMLLGNNSHTAQMWLEYANLERACGDDKHLRSLYQKALQTVHDWPESIGEAWICFESENGSLGQWEQAANKYETRMKIIQEKRNKETGNENVKREKSPGGKFQKNKRKFDKTKDEKKAVVDDDGFKVPSAPVTKGKWENLASKEEPQKKKMKKENAESDHGELVPHDTSKDPFTIFLSNLAFDAPEDKIKEIFEQVDEVVEIRLVKDYKGRKKGFGYLQFKTKEAVTEALKKDREPLNGRPMFVSRCRDKKKASSEPKLKFSTEMEKNKLFVRNLPATTTKEDLQKMFEPHGELIDIRIVTYRNGHSKGIAYVDFKKEESAANAVAKLNESKIGDKIISVAISAPPRRSEKGDSKQFLGGGDRLTTTDRTPGGRNRSRTQISLVPRALQRSLKESNPGCSKDQLNGSQNGKSETIQQKSNADFRNMLLNK